MHVTKKMSHKLRFVLFVAASFAWSWSGSAQADTYTVTTLGDGAGACTGISPNFSCPTLRAAITAANATTTVDDSIQFNVSGTINLVSQLPDITDTLTLNGSGITLNGGGASFLGIDLVGPGASNSQVLNLGITNLSLWAIRIQDANGLTISNNAISNINRNAIQIQGNTLGGTSNSIFSNNTITNIAAGDGIAFQPGGTSTVQYNNNLLQGNTINGCTGQGISFDGSKGFVITNNTVTGNTVTNCNGHGVEVTGLNADNNAIYANSIYANGGLAINLNLNNSTGGVTLNDVGDVDVGPNGLQNFPIVTGISGNTVNFVLDTVSNPNGFRIDFYNNPSGVDPTGYGEGQTWLGFCLVASPSAILPSSCSIPGVDSASVRMTATRCQNSGCVATSTTTIGATSEFSGPSPTNLVITKTDGQTVYTPGQTVNYTIVVSNSGATSVSGAMFTDPAVANLTINTVACSSPTLNSQCPTAGNVTKTLMQGAGIVVPLLTPGGSVTFTVNATFDAAAAGSITNTASVAVPAGVTETVPANNTVGDTDQKATTLTLRKQWSGAVVGDSTTVTISRGATVLDTLVSTAGSANELDTDSTPVTVNTGDVLTLVEVLVVANAGLYNGSVACTGTSGLSGTTLTVGNTDSTIVCTYTNIHQQADLSITKSDGGTQVVSGTTTTYTIVASNGGPSAANNAVVKDVPGAGLSGCVATCASTTGGAMCPATPANMFTVGGETIPVFPANSSVTFTVACSVL